MTEPEARAALKDIENTARAFGVFGPWDAIRHCTASNALSLGVKPDEVMRALVESYQSPLNHHSVAKGLP